MHVSKLIREHANMAYFYQIDVWFCGLWHVSQYVFAVSDRCQTIIQQVHIRMYTVWYFSDSFKRRSLIVFYQMDYAGTDSYQTDKLENSYSIRYTYCEELLGYV